MYETAAEVSGYKTSRHQDWFDEQDTEARALLDTMHATHLARINYKNSTAKKAACTRARQSVQVKLRMMREKWWTSKSQELQDAADPARH